MPIYNPGAQLLYSNAGDQTLGTTFSGTGTVHSNPNALIDLRYTCDVWLSVFAAGTSTGTTPTMDVYLDVQDSNGNWFLQVVHATQITAAPGYSSQSAGIHIAGNGSLVLPAWGRVTVTLGGTTPVYPNVTINVWGR